MMLQFLVMEKKLLNRLVFDIDDSLYLESDYVLSGFRSVGEWMLTYYGVEGFFEKARNYFLEGNRGDIFNRVLADININDNDLVPKLVDIYRAHEPVIHLLPDVQLFFESCCANKLAIITDGYSVSQWTKIRSLKLEKWIEKIIVTDDWGREYWKPHPRAFETVQSSFSPECCVYIADNPLKDFIAPTKLGWMPSIRIRRIGSIHYNVPTPDNCIEVTSFAEITSVLSRKQKCL